MGVLYTGKNFLMFSSGTKTFRFIFPHRELLMSCITATLNQNGLQYMPGTVILGVLIMLPISNGQLHPVSYLNVIIIMYL